MKQLVVMLVATSACSALGPAALKASRTRYNETIRTTAEEEMLLNIVRLRYGDTPSSLAVSSIAAQFELASNVGGAPFYTASTDPTARAPFPLVLPQAGVSVADRPTFSLTPLDDSDFARRLFTPLSLEGTVYLARTTWPIATVFRLYLENLNWIPNAQTASGPTPVLAPPASSFREGIAALQRLQDRGDIVFGQREDVAPIGTSVATPTVTAEASVAAAQQGLEFENQPGGASRLVRRVQVPVLHLNPKSLESTDVRAFTSAFHLAPGLARYDLAIDTQAPFDEPQGGYRRLELETRSLLQALYFLSHGVDVPDAHLASGVVRVTKQPNGEPFDWRAQLDGLFRVRSSSGGCGGVGAAAAVEYRGHCFFLEETDHETRATFALLIELARLEVPSGKRNGPILTLPLGQ